MCLCREKVRKTTLFDYYNKCVSFSANALHYFYMILKFAALVVAITLFYASEVSQCVIVAICCPRQ